MFAGRRQLRFPVEGEAGLDSPSEPEACCRAEGGASARRRAGWTRRFLGAPPRLQEAVELYESLGLEVRLERPEPEDLAAECEECPAARSLFRVIYTRPRGRAR
ncbi:MAG: hypothetical protein ACE5HP_08450 [Gemmatimonadota bacterium]